MGGGRFFHGNPRREGVSGWVGGGLNIFLQGRNSHQDWLSDPGPGSERKLLSHEDWLSLLRIRMSGNLQCEQFFECQFSSLNCHPVPARRWRGLAQC